MIGKIRSSSIYSRSKRLKRKLEDLSTTQNLSKIMWTIKGFIDNDVNIIYPSSGGGIVELNPELPLIVVSDSHGLRSLFSEFLFERKYINGKTNFELLAQGKLQILMLGDAFHTENKGLWTNALIDEYMKQYVHHKFYGDMPRLEKEIANGLGLAAMIMILLSHFNDFYYLKGNHDNIRNTEEDGNRKVVKYFDNPDHGEGAMIKAALEAWLVKRSLMKEGLKSWETFLKEYEEIDEKLQQGNYTLEKFFNIYNEWQDDLQYLKGQGGWIFFNDFLVKFAHWENRLPVFAIYENSTHKIAISHAPPGALSVTDRDMIRDRSDEIVFNFTWPNDLKARRGEYVQNIFKVVFDGDSIKKKLYIAGHINSDEGVELFNKNHLVIINKPGNLVVLIVCPDRDLFGIDMISFS